MSPDMSTNDDTHTYDDGPTWNIDGEVWSPGDLLRAIEARDQRIDALEERLEELEAENNSLRDRLDEQARETEAQWAEIETVQDRTDLLQFIENADQTSAAEARAAILQHMWRMVRDEEGEDRVYAMSRSKTEEILHGPDVHRTTINSWMRDTAEQLVGNGDVCWYEGGDPGPGGQEARIVLDMRGRDHAALPEDLNNP